MTLMSRSRSFASIGDRTSGDPSVGNPNAEIAAQFCVEEDRGQQRRRNRRRATHNDAIL